jgi:hypothetical protein
MTTNKKLYMPMIAKVFDSDESCQYDNLDNEMF